MFSLYLVLVTSVNDLGKFPIEKVRNPYEKRKTFFGDIQGSFTKLSSR